MSPLQLYTCVDEADRYALCCVNMNNVAHNNVDPDVEETLSKIKSLTTIGLLAADAEKAVAGKNDGVHLGGSYSCIVPQ